MSLVVIVIASTFLGVSDASAQSAAGASSADRVARLIVDLNDDRFQVRETAMRELVERSIEAEPLLRRIATEPGAIEVRERARVALRLIMNERNPKVIAQLSGHSAIVNMAAFSPDGETLVSGSEDGSFVLWRWRTDKSRRMFRPYANGLLFLAFSPNGQSLVTTGRDGQVKIWNADPCELQTTLGDHQGAVSAASFSPDGRLLVTAGDDTKVKVREASGALRYVLDGHKRPVIALVFSPDGKTLFSGGGSWNSPRQLGEVQAWNLETRQRLWSATGDFGGVWGLAISSDGRRLAGACLDGVARLWDAQSGRDQAQLMGHADRVIWIAFRPGDSLLASTSYDGTVRLWDTQRNVEYAALTAHVGPVQRLSFTPDGKFFATTGNDRTIRIWKFPN